MNFLRGTGLRGLTGIPAIGTHFSMAFIRRPLLPFSKDELLRFAKQNNLKYAEDSSNQSSKYTRNLFRNEIIPAIAKAYPTVKENLRNNVDRFKEIEKLYNLSVTMLKDKLCRERGEELHIPIKQLMQFNSRALIYEIISIYGFSERQIDEIIKLADADSGSYIPSARNDFRIIRHRHWFIIAPAISSFTDTIIIAKGMRRTHFKDGNLLVEHIDPPQTIANNQLEAYVDESQIEFPLLLRRWKAGDYFYPFGMRKKKKLARFLIDQKLSKTDKEKIWVIEMKQKIIWVVGHRIDDRFRVTDKTKSILKITLQTG
jgi:tRNA(Ile)-lysidine synthase